MITRYFLILITLFFHSFFIAAQERTAKIDSLSDAITQAKSDTAKALLMNHLLWEYVETNPKLTLQYAQETLDFCQKIDFKRGLGNIYFDLGTIYRRQGNYGLSLENYFNSLQIRKLLPSKSDLARTYNGLGNTYADLGNYSISLQNYFESLKIQEQIHNKEGIARALGNIGTVYSDQENYPKALEFYQKALEINESLKNFDLLRYNLNNIGVIYQKQNENSKALAYFLKTLTVNENTKNSTGVSQRNYLQIWARTLNYLGEVRLKLNDKRKSLENYQQALGIFTKTNDELGVAIVLQNIALFYKTEKEYVKSLEFAKKSLVISQKIDAKEKIKNSASLLAELYENIDSKIALQYYKLATTMKDSLYSLDKDKVVSNLQAGYDLDKKQKQIEIIEKESKLKDEEVKNINLQKNGFIGGLVLFALFIVFLIKGFREQRKANTLLEAKNIQISEQREELSQFNQEILAQNEELHQQQEEITAQRDFIAQANNELNLQYSQIHKSVEAAKLIQDAILPFESRVHKFLPNYFVLYRPKDVVSGDFFWIEEVDNNIYVAVVDCTGHGVPGAFMSMIANTLLDNIIKVQKIFSPDKVLQALNEEIHNALKQKNADDANKNIDGRIDDNSGMDAAFVRIEKTADSFILSFAGAKRPLYYVSAQTKQVTTVKGDKHSIGGKRSFDKVFTKRIIELPYNSTFYLFSDGYADQCNAERISFGSLKLQELISKIAPLEMKTQKEMVANTLDSFRQNAEQRDDILLVGVKLN
jgi:serine phosphatase RsbU (regulator of sigma subunit)